ncbi:amidohydrolase family protein [Kerstersia gyiorum]|uniref:amidohydrolase family protein n=1 Tax=Kerstersia gyiorum TaxID=206506 RepID=UPI00209F4814|nr:amidohydrolase family protein [Kerstersia gyiorum]MCP1633090.1 putative TIM-barrel fold metal-dependent hydrolase [Kerstersia gyiorum]MCP1682609.1 putative TIM-barrel fold metal-dependent hydrolase [Kerstersia gyiorum]MCP1718250.1 putative TIM-barrel fold metal-dependent hydrolase [Kerstersia gyiorum]MCW2187485.1 putative TIM-barrel fold metal-dependent hydrolase [Kerstersia gyiorum]
MSSHPQTETAALCRAPLAQFEAPAFDVPPGAVDTHAHVVADSDAYPMVANRSYTPPPAPEQKYLAMLDNNHMSHGVLIQISVYGTDNRYMLEVLRRNPQRLRGIAVVDADISDCELLAMHEAGVRGLRINVLFGGGIGFEAMERLAARIAPLGWHMQFLMDVRDLPELMPRMTRLPVPGVIDHMGHAPVSMGLDAPGYQAMRSLVADHGFWVKLSGAYRISDDFEAFRDVQPLAQSLIELAPDRMVWGSDWPHVAREQMPDTGKLLNLLPQWAPDATTRRRILVDNPARLYGFPATPA